MKLATLLAFVLIFAGCWWGDDEPTGPSIVAIGPAGGEVSSADGSVMLRVPPGALSEEVNIQIVINDVTSQSFDTLFFAEVGPIIDLLPDGLTFNVPTEIEVTLGPEFTTPEFVQWYRYLPDQDVLVLYHHSQVDVATRTLTTELDHFSTWVAAIPARYQIPFGSLDPVIVTWNVTSFPTGGPLSGQPNQVKVLASVTRALSDWQHHLNNRIVFQKVTSSSPDLEVAFRATEPDGRVLAAGEEGVASYFCAFFSLRNPRTCSVGKRLIVLNTGGARAWVWNDVELFVPLHAVNGPIVELTVKHELGHLLGLYHDPNGVGAPPVMAQNANSVGPQALGSRPLTNDCQDLKNLNSRYPFVAVDTCAVNLVLRSPATANLSAPIGATVLLPFTVQVTDASNRGVGGVTVVFRPGAGTTAAGRVKTTDINGLADVDSWTLGNMGSQAYQLSATIFGPGPAPNFQITQTITGTTGFPALSINDVAVTEGASGTTVSAVFTVTLSAQSTQQVNVDVSTSNGTATAPDDYTAIGTTTLTFPPGTTTRTVTVAVKGDEADEENETYHVNLTNAVNATITDARGVGTITNEDVPTLSIDDVTVVEGTGSTVNAVFTVSLLAPSVRNVSVVARTTDGTAKAPDDYTAVGETMLMFPPGTTTQTVTVAVKGDALDEPDETYTVDLSDAVNATLTDAQGVGTITDDDPEPTLSINDVTVVEGTGPTVNSVFTVTLSEESGQEVKVDVATADATAVSPDDYTAVGTTTLTFPPGTTTKTVTVAVKGDELDEPNETYTVNLTNAANATITDAQGVGTITDDDAEPTLSIDDVAVTEGDPGTTVNAVFTVALSEESGQEVKVDVSTSDGTAVAPDDYTAVGTTTLTFPPGATTKTVTVAVKGDALVEANETYTVNLTNAVNATITDAQGVGTITTVLAVDFETPLVGSDGQTFDPYVHSGTGISFKAETPLWTVDLVWNSITSACVEPADQDQKLGTALGRSNQPIRATLPSPLGAGGSVSVEFQTPATVITRLRLYDSGGTLVASVTQDAGPPNGTCGFPGGPRARLTVTAGTSSELAYAIMDVMSNHVFVIDNFTVTPN